jgi:Protein of unknown function (DUF3320)
MEQLGVERVDRAGTDDDAGAGGLLARIEALEARVQALEAAAAAGGAGVGAAAPAGSTRRAAPAGTPAGTAVAGRGAPAWTVPYRVAELSVGETWIEMHEPSARPQLHRLIRETVAAEGPITQGLALRRVREAWGLKRAGARVQDVFDQAVRQLVAAGYLVREGGDIREEGQQLRQVRVPAADERTRRAADEIAAAEIELAMERTVAELGPLAADELTAAVSRLFGWTRRGAGIQAALDTRLEALVGSGRLAREAGVVRVVPSEV